MTRRFAKAYHSHGPRVRKHKNITWTNRDAKVAAAVHQPTPERKEAKIQFSKSQAPQETMKLLIEPLTTHAGNESHWITKYYDHMKNSAKNGDEVAALAPKPDLSKKLDVDESLDASAQSVVLTSYLNEYKARVNAARIITQTLVGAVSNSTRTKLESMEPEQLGLSDKYEDFDAYMKSVDDSTRDPVLIYNMITKAVINECLENETIPQYANRYFNSIVMKDDEHIGDFKNRFKIAIEHITMLVNGKQHYMPWVNSTVEPPVDLKIAYFMSKLSGKHYKEDKQTGLKAIAKASTKSLPKSLRSAIAKAEVNKTTFNQAGGHTDTSPKPKPKIVAAAHVAPPQAQGNNRGNNRRHNHRGANNTPSPFTSRSANPQVNQVTLNCDWCHQPGHTMLPSKLCGTKTYCPQLYEKMRNNSVVTEFVTKVSKEMMLSDAGRRFIGEN